MMLGQNSFESEDRGNDYLAKLFERMLFHTITQNFGIDRELRISYEESLPRAFVDSIHEHHRGQQGESARLMRQKVQFAVRGTVRGRCGGLCADLKSTKLKFGLPHGIGWTAFFYLVKEDGKPAQLVAAATPWANRKGDNWLSNALLTRVAGEVKDILTSWWGQVSKIAELYARARRGSDIMKKVSLSPQSIRDILEKDGFALSQKIMNIKKKWQEDCPHFTIASIKVLLPRTLPAECHEKDYIDSHMVVPPDCTLSKAKSLGALCEPKKLVENPFFGSIVLVLSGSQFWNVANYLTRDDHTKACDAMEGKKILVDTVPIVPIWSYPLDVPPPEIPSSAKEGCRGQGKVKNNVSSEETETSSTSSKAHEEL